ncbi:MAG: PAS domain S-box protein [Negativicutes bacterium]|nr:PAS domain S-box protein [Negativicutes bacterium]
MKASRRSKDSILKCRLFDYSTDIMAAFDFDGRFMLVNDALTAVLGWTVREVAGSKFIDLVHPDDCRSTLEEFGRLCAGHTTHYFENRYRCRDGSYRLLAWKAYPDFDDRLVFAVAYDITDHRRLEEECRYQQELYRMVLEGSNDGIWDWNLVDNRIYLSPRCREMLGYNHEELPDDLAVWWDLMPDDDRRQAREYLDRFLRGEIGRYSNSFRMRHKDGSYRWILSRAALLRDENGRPVRLAGSHTDITGRKRDEERLNRLNRQLQEAEERARQASEVKSQFLGAVSHELRTPLNVIFGMNYQLMGSQLDEFQRECVGEIEAAAKRLLVLVEDIMLYAQFEGKSLESGKAVLSLPALLAGLQSRFSPLAAAKNLLFVLDMGDGVEDNYYCCDDMLIERLLAVLLDNAIKFTCRGFVRLDVERLTVNGRQVKLRFRVSDSGIGIAAGQRDSIFELFRQGDGSTTRGFGGVGIGLALAQKIARAMGSSVQFDSQPGCGATFYFDLEVAGMG